MARSKSAVLSPADKKAVVTDIKAKIKELTGSIKGATGVIKLAEKEFKTIEKDQNKAVAGFTKELNKLQADLAAITQVA